LNLSRRDGRPLVVGHRGAAAVAPENTLASVAAAVDAGVDLVEFDVGGDLTLAHSAAEVPDEPVSLDEALDFLRGRGVGAHLDLKAQGSEEAVVDALRRHGLAERAVVSSALVPSLRRLAVIAPELPRAIGYPHDRLGVSSFSWPARVTTPAAAALRAVIPARVPLLLRRARANVLALHHTLLSSASVAASHRAGAPVLAWTVNDPAAVERLVAAGVDGVVSDDPEMVLTTLATLKLL
jgi:glycerophosphoryl diester phosphodiesterase